MYHIAWNMYTNMRTNSIQIALLFFKRRPSPKRSPPNLAKVFDKLTNIFFSLSSFILKFTLILRYGFLSDSLLFLARWLSNVTVLYHRKSQSAF